MLKYVRMRTNKLQEELNQLFEIHNCSRNVYTPQYPASFTSSFLHSKCNIVYATVDISIHIGTITLVVGFESK